MRSVVEVLKLDHRKIEALFDAVEVTPDITTRAMALQAIAFELEAHAYAEESIVYLKAATLEPLRDESKNAYEDHVEIRRLILQLEKTPVQDPAWMEQFTPTELQTMACEVLETKEKLAKAGEPTVRAPQSLYAQVESERVRCWI